MRRWLVVVAVVVTAVVVGAGALAPPGVFSSGTDGSDGSASPDAGTATTTPDVSASDGTTDRPFGFVVDRIEKCGRTCRDVTTTLSNEQQTAASNVHVETRIYAGNDTGGDPVWTGERSVGDLAANESTTTTTRVKLGLVGALAIENAGGWITVETTVSSDEETMTLTVRRQVA